MSGLQPYVTATPVSASASATTSTTTSGTSAYAEPYVTASATAISSSSLKKSGTKKKKSKKKNAAAEEDNNVELTSSSYSGTGTTTYTNSTNTYSTTKPKSSKSSSSSKSKKSKKSSKSSSSKSSSSKSSSKSNLAQSHVVLKASGWKQLKPKDMNAYSAVAVTDAKHQYAITGNESQIVTVAIPPGETCQGEPGSMMYLTSPITMKVSCGSDWFGRCCGGESCCVLNFRNKKNETGYAALVTNLPLAKVVPVDLGSPEVGGSLIVQQGAYMASYGDVKITFSCDFNFVRCCCGGMGLVRQKLHGTGTAFLGATGTIVQKVLEEDEVMLMDTNCILAYSETCTFDLKKTGGIVNWIGGGEGFFNSSLKGPGLVIVQSMNMVIMLESLAANKMYRR